MDQEGLIAIVLSQEALLVYLLHEQCRTESKDCVFSYWRQYTGYNRKETKDRGGDKDRQCIRSQGDISKHPHHLHY